MWESIPPVCLASDTRQSIIEEELLLTGNTLPSSSTYGHFSINYKYKINKKQVACCLRDNLQLHPMIRKPGHGIHRPMHVEERSPKFFMTPRVIFCQNLWRIHHSEHYINENITKWKIGSNYVPLLINISNLDTFSKAHHIVKTMPIRHIASPSSRNSYLPIQNF